MRRPRFSKNPFDFFKRFSNSKNRKFSNFENRLLSLRYPIYTYIIAANFATYWLWNSGVFSDQFLTNHMTVSKANLKAFRLHTLITHSFAHYGFMQLGFNSLGVYFIGKSIEAIFGPRVFLIAYFAGVIAGGLVTALSQHQFDRRSFIGSTSGVCSLFAFYAMNFPYHKVFVFPIPIPISAWIICTFMFFYSLRYSLDGSSRIGNVGVVGGVLTGAAYYFIFNSIII